MGKYYDQEYIQKKVAELKASPTIFQVGVKQNLVYAYARAKYEVDRISDYTAPEEIGIRYQTLFYYEDFFSEMGWDKGNG
ncbi:hypothetical protein EOM81_01755 [bacterium]|nr:hypothetical protein [bacterium]